LDDQTVFDPPRRGEDGDDLHITGIPRDGGPETDRGRREGEGLRNRGLVPYRDVIGGYRDDATRTIERDGYPLRLRQTVRDYFDRLGG
jgi:hypothetical protein